MDVRPIRSEADHAWALREIAAYFDLEPDPGTPEGDRFEVLAALIEGYETKHHAIPNADPVQVLHFAIEDLGRSQAQLAEVLGSKSRASEILKRRRPLTLEMIRAISEAWKIPYGALSAPYRLADGAKGRRDMPERDRGRKNEEAA